MFAQAIGLRCFIHMQNNIKRKMRELRLSPDIQDDIMQDIFGAPLGNAGLLNSDDVKEFERKDKVAK